MAMWSPWRGCRRYSEGCKYCYIHKGDYKKGNYKMKAGQMVYLCFQTDFLIEDADMGERNVGR